MDLTKDHKARTVEKGELKRIHKTGYIVRDGKIVSGEGTEGYE